MFGIAWRRVLLDLLRMSDRVLEYSQRFFHIFMRILGPCLVCLALSLIGFVAYTWFVYSIHEFQLQDITINSLSMIAFFLLGNILYNYLKSICTSAGTPPVFEEAKMELTNVEEGRRAKPRQCGKCGLLKPPRAHHCSVCGRCVMKMDHHCPWVNNCVGHGNYRYFCLFLFFLALGCLFVITVYGSCFYDIIFTWRRRGSRSFRQYVLMSFMICCSILAALSILGGFHFFLALTNQTTIEFQINMIRRREYRHNGEFYRNPYDLGRSRNCESVFGPNSLCSLRWAFPWLPGNLPPTGDGIVFPSISRLRV